MCKIVEVLNEYFSSKFTTKFSTPDYAAQCLACHGANYLFNARTQESCEHCHGDPHETNNVAELGGTPKTFKFEQNYPNPFNPSTRIQFSIPKQSKVNLAFYDIMGSTVAT
ncbi:MAG: hypothetical protein PF445_00855 [Melioribacteraceae bacterium]|nr:hypothetical protein [Melioribacteraceae bacterium]